MLTATQRRTAEAVDNFFATNEVRGKYGSVTRIPGYSGHLTFGRSQTTLASGNLHDFLKQYSDNGSARFASALAPYLLRLRDRNLDLDTDVHFHNVGR